MKPEADPERCSDCGKPVYNHQKASITPLGVFHQNCGIPDPDEM